MLKRKAAEQKEPAPKQDGPLPLFFQRPTPLDAERHAKAGLLPMTDMGFAMNTNSIVINAVEFFEAAKSYPIVFTMGDVPVPAAIVGLEQHNYFVNADKQWKDGAYIPAYVRKYPFAFMNGKMEGNDAFVLCVDEASAQYKEKAAKKTQPLFENGAPSALAKNALEFCTAYQNRYKQTQQFCAGIKAAGLFSPMRSDAKLKNGREIHLGGFQMIDEAKVRALPQETVLDFFQKGWLPLLYAALMSSSNWKRLADMASQDEVL